MKDSLRAFFRSLFRRPRETQLDRVEKRLMQAAERFRLAAEASPGVQARLLWRLAGATTELQTQLRAHPKATLPLKRLVLIYIPEMAQIAEKWAACADQNPLAPLNATMMKDFENFLNAIQDAAADCAEGRDRDLRWASTVLDEIMQRHRA